jgi:hypothetical protein
MPVMALRFGRCRRLKLLDRTAVAWLLPPLCLMSYRFTVLDAIGEADRAFALLSPLFERLQEQGRSLFPARLRARAGADHAPAAARQGRMNFAGP